MHIQQQILDLIEAGIFVQVSYEMGDWMYVLFQLPSKENVEFAATSTCQDKDLWLDAQQLTNNWWDQEYPNYTAALEAGIKEAQSLCTNQKDSLQNNTP